MLVLSRKKDESIVVDGQIVVTILGQVGNRISIGISAPNDLRIVRHELLASEDKA